VAKAQIIFLCGNTSPHR